MEKTAIEQLIEKIKEERELAEIDLQYSIDVSSIMLKQRAENFINGLNKCLAIAELSLPIEKEQMINFHIEVMKKGLIDEGEAKWTDSYLPTIKQVCEEHFNETFKKD